MLDDHLLSLGWRSAMERAAYLIAFLYQRTAGVGLSASRGLMDLAPWDGPPGKKTVADMTCTAASNLPPPWVIGGPHANSVQRVPDR